MPSDGNGDAAQPPGPGGITRYELFEAWWKYDGKLVAQSYQETGVDPELPWDLWYLSVTGMTWQQMMDEPAYVHEARREFELAKISTRGATGDG